MVDAHAHLDRYGPDLPRALAQIRAMSIRTLAVSMDVASFRVTQHIAKAEPLILSAFGIHPWEAPRFAADLEALATPLQEAKLIGEIGLDHRFVTDDRLYEAQRIVFDHLLDAAERSGRPVNLHTAGAESIVLECLRQHSLSATIVHWYSGPTNLVADYLDLGAYFTVGVEVLRSPEVQDFAAKLPADRLLTETDNPGGWKWLTSEIGFPDLLARVEATLAEIRGCSREELCAQIEENLTRVLRAGGIETEAP